MNYPSTQSHDPAPAEYYVPVTPSDSVALTAGTCRALYIGTQGVISPVTNAAVTFSAAIGLLPIRTNQVKLTGTTATNIVALY
jgi:hypothetical protein